jgi:hypothetical protein
MLLRAVVLLVGIASQTRLFRRVFRSFSNARTDYGYRFA